MFIASGEENYRSPLLFRNALCIASITSSLINKMYMLTQFSIEAEGFTLPPKENREQSTKLH